MSKTYLVTGGAGFIGANFIHHMLRKYPHIHIINLDKLTYAGNLENLQDVEHDARYRFIQGDILDSILLDSIFAQYNPEYIINFAAESHVDRSIEAPDVFVQTNIMGTVSLLNMARKAWILGDDTYRTGVKYLQVSTDEVYGSLGAEGFFTEETPLDPHSPYAASKASADLLVQAYADTYQLPVNITRCSNNYGPYQFPEKLIPLMIHNALQHKELPIYGDGMQVRDWLYVEDHARALDMVLHQGSQGEVYNIGGHNERFNIDIVRAILGYLHEHIDKNIGEHLMRHVTDRKGHDRRYAIDPAKITRELGWYPETSFDQGIQITMTWYLRNLAWLERVTSGEYQDYYGRMYQGR